MQKKAYLSIRLHLLLCWTLHFVSKETRLGAFHPTEAHPIVGEPAKASPSCGTFKSFSFYLNGTDVFFLFPKVTRFF